MEWILLLLYEIDIILLEEMIKFCVGYEEMVWKGYYLV